jgi:hypothetical protein
MQELLARGERVLLKNNLPLSVGGIFGAIAGLWH